MKTISQSILAGAIAAAAFGLPAFAQQAHAAGASAAPSAAKAGEMSEGEVRKLDLAARKITLKHGPLKNLGMPGMTMAFEVSDPSMLGKVKVGQNVRFVADESGGKLRITHIEAAK